MFERHCPKCGRVISYKHEATRDAAESAGTRCRSCFTTENNPFRGKTHSAETKLRMSRDRAGRKPSDATRKKMSEAKRGKGNSFYGRSHSDDARSRISQSSKRFKGENNPFFGRRHDDETRRRMSASRARGIAEGRINCEKNGRGRKGWHVSSRDGTSQRFDSMLELFRMQQLDVDACVSSWTKRHGITIPYEVDGVTRNYVPDFLIVMSDGRRIIEEVKGRDARGAQKRTALQAFCEREGMESRWTTQDVLEKEGYRQWIEKS